MVKGVEELMDASLIEVLKRKRRVFDFRLSFLKTFKLRGARKLGVYVCTSAVLPQTRGF